MEALMLRLAIRRGWRCGWLGLALVLPASLALAQWPPTPPRQPSPGPTLRPMPGPPQGPSAPPREATVQSAPSGSPTRIESEALIVEYTPDLWVKDSVRISPDGKRFAVVIQSEDKRQAYVSIDGQKHRSYGWARDLTFSGDSRHVAYVATVEGKDLPVVDGREGAFRGEIWGGTRAGGGTLRLNRDGTRVAFVARKGNAPAFGVVIDGAMDRPVVDPNDGAPAFSPDGKRLAYIAQEGAQRFVVLDGKPGPKYDTIYKGTLTFSPESGRLAYLAGKGGQWVVVVDGAEGKPRTNVVVTTLRFSPDGARLAYAAETAPGKWAVVVNEEAGPDFDYIGPFTGVVWRPDSRQCLYAGQVDKRWAIVIDDTAYTFEDVGAVAFSADSARLAFYARADGQWRLAVTDPQGSRGIALGAETVLNDTLAFSPDGKHLVLGAMTGGRPHMVVDGKPAQSFYEAIWNVDGGRVVFDTPTSFSYIALRGGKVYLVREAVILLQ